MTDSKSVVLEHRGVLELTGADMRAFLQGIVSNDVGKVSPTQAVWSAFLTPQGKFLHEFTLFQAGEETILLEGEAERLADLQRRLSLYKLRANVALADVRDRYLVVALFGAEALSRLELAEEPGAAKAWGGGWVAVDPRLAALGARAILPRDGAESALKKGGFAPVTLAEYDRLRITLGIPDGSRDMEVEKAILLENGFDELGGVDWSKGCFMGQELTARTKYRALIKKRLLPVTFDGPPPPPGTAIQSDGREVGKVFSVAGDSALALLRLEFIAAPLTIEGAAVTPRTPDWLKLPEPKASA